METTTRWDERSTDRHGLMSELESVAHGLRTAATALYAEHEVMARYATRAADFVDGAGEKLKSSPRLVASLDQLRQGRPKAVTPTASLLGFIGTRVLSMLAGPEPRAAKPEPIQHDEEAQTDELSIAEQLSSADELVIEAASDEPRPTFEPWSHAAALRVATEEPPSFNEADFPPAERRPHVA